MKKYTVLLLIPLLAGCISWNQQASLTTKYKDASKSINELESPKSEIENKEINDTESDQIINFYYEDVANPINLKKITSTYKPSVEYKEVMNLHFEEGKITMANLEIHELDQDYTKLSNHSFTIKDNQVDKHYTKGILQNQNESFSSEEIISQINSNIQYINSTYLNL